MKNLLACYANCRFTTRCDELRNEIIEKPDQATTDINSYLGERGQRLIQIQFPKRGVKFIEAGKQASETRPAKSLLRIDRKEMPEMPQMKNAPPTFTRTRARAALPNEPAMTTLPPVPFGGEGRLPRPKRRLKAIKKSAVVRPGEPKPKIFKAEAQGPRKEPALKKRASVKKPPRATAAALAAMKEAPGADLKASGAKKPGRKKAERKIAAAVPDKSSRPGKAAPAEIRKAVSQSTEMSEQLTDKEKSVKPKKSSSNKRGASPASRSGRKQGKKFIILEGKSASLVDEHGLMLHIMSGSSPEARYFEVNEVEARVQIVTKK
ncbi:MAG TPA: hypothetical protein VE262_12215 [Blastocatellia bacterium]|nr:hypothetical protein [Blastocatellia bacterium]